MLNYCVSWENANSTESDNFNLGFFSRRIDESDSTSLLIFIEFASNKISSKISSFVILFSFRLFLPIQHPELLYKKYIPPYDLP